MTDSAGVRIVDVDADVVRDAYVVSDTPFWSVGGAGSEPDELALHAVVDVELVDGGLWIAEGGSQQLIFIDLTTRAARRRIGGRGNGPAEFQALTRVFDAGAGHTGAFDARRRRYVEFDSTGQVVSEQAVPQIGLGSRDHYDRLSDGSTILASIASFYPAGGTGREPSPVVHVHTSVDTIVLVPGTEAFQTDDAVGGVLLGSTTLIASDGTGVWVGDNAESVVRYWLPDADTPSMLIRWRTTRSRRVTDDMREEFWSGLHAMEPDADPAILGHMRETFPMADSVPAFGRLIASRSGEIWIGGYPGPVETLEQPWPALDWIVVDPARGSVRTATTPPGFKLFEVTEEYLVGVHEDDLGVESVWLLEYAARDEPGDPEVACRPLERSPAATIESFALPSNLSIGTAVVTEMEGRRGSESAPYSIIAATIVDDAGNVATAEPALWLVIGGTSGEHDGFAKGYFTLNDVSVDLAMRELAELEPAERQRRQGLRDARSLAPPVTSETPDVQRLIECLRQFAISRRVAGTAALVAPSLVRGG